MQQLNFKHLLYIKSKLDCISIKFYCFKQNHKDLFNTKNLNYFFKHKIAVSKSAVKIGLLVWTLGGKHIQPDKLK